MRSQSILAAPASKRGKWVVLGLWFALLVAGAPFGARFEDAQENDPASFLPEGSDSLQALELSGRFPSGQQTRATVIFRRDSGLTRADREAIARFVAELRERPPPFAGPPLPARYAPDGSAALVIVPLADPGELDRIAASVEDIRERLRLLPAGLTAKVGGPAGFTADVSDAFEDINTRLLLATATLVFVLLVLIYRRPVFWIVPLLSILAAETAVRSLGYLVIQAGVTVNGQAGGILLVLVFGAGTDYALLLVSRYREELRRRPDRHEAMRVALRQAGPAILASAGTVVAGLACLALARVNATAGIGTIGALGVALAALATLTILPALLVATGTWVFWPFVPRAERPGARGATHGVFAALGRRIAGRPRAAWIVSTLLLLVACAGLARLDFSLTSTDSFRGSAEAVEAQALIARSFPAGATAPATVIVREPDGVSAVRAALARTPGVEALGPVEQGSAGARFEVTLAASPYSVEAFRLIPRLRATLERAAGQGVVLLGGPTAEEHDTRVAAARDTLLLPPLVLVVVLVILMMLLRSLVAPLLLVATVVASFAATLGVSMLAFTEVFGFAGIDPSFPLIAFIFLVALGVDYNIFLMARVREEALAAETRAGVLRGLAATGSVITSAGLVLAGTFAVLCALPFVPLIQIGFTVAFGVLLDTLLVRSVLVPALALDLDRRVWWPSALARPASAAAAGAVAPGEDAIAVERGRRAR